MQSREITAEEHKLVDAAFDQYFDKRSKWRKQFAIAATTAERNELFNRINDSWHDLHSELDRLAVYPTLSGYRKRLTTEQ